VRTLATARCRKKMNMPSQLSQQTDWRRHGENFMMKIAEIDLLKSVVTLWNTEGALSALQLSSSDTLRFCHAGVRSSAEASH